MIRGIHHVAISTPDLDRLIAFYRDVIGMELVKVSGWEAWRLTDDLLIAESDGRFDAQEYARQLAEGI